MLTARCATSTFLSAMMLYVSAASGQDYPNKPIRIITSNPGGSSDTTSRQIAQGISGPLGQPVIVENRVYLVAAATLAKAPPDGYTLLVGGEGLWILPLLQKAPYDAAADFAPVTLLLRVVSVLVVHPSLPVKNVKELIALAKAKPGELNYSTASIGGTGHLGAELFKSMAGVNIVNVTYKGNAPALTALLAGETQMTITDIGLVTPHTKSGRLRALAVTSAQPSVLAPGLATVAASGLPGYEVIGITGVWVPAKTPAAIINRLNQDILRVFNQPGIKEKVFAGGLEVVGSSPEQFGTTMKSEIAKWSKVIKDAGIKVN